MVSPSLPCLSSFPPGLTPNLALPHYSSPVVHKVHEAQRLHVHLPHKRPERQCRRLTLPCAAPPASFPLGPTPLPQAGWPRKHSVWQRTHFVLPIPASPASCPLLPFNPNLCPADLANTLNGNGGTFSHLTCQTPSPLPHPPITCSSPVVYKVHEAQRLHAPLPHKRPERQRRRLALPIRINRQVPTGGIWLHRDV